MIINSITVVTSRHGSDTIILHTDLPEAAYPFKKAQGTLSMAAARDQGEQYCKNNFPGVPVRVV